MKPPETPESPEAPEPSADDAGETSNGGGRRHLRLRRNRSEARLGTSHAEPTDQSEGPGQRRKYVRMTDERSTATSSAAIDAAERELVQRKEELLHTLRAAQAADANSVQVHADAEAAAEEAKRVAEHEAGVRERLQEEVLEAAEAEHARRQAEAEEVQRRNVDFERSEADRKEESRAALRERGRVGRRPACREGE